MNKIDAILLTHLHGDHCFGIFGLLCTMATQGRTKPVVIAGPKGVKELVDTVLRLAGGFGGYTLEFIELGTQHACATCCNARLSCTASRMGC